MVLVSNWATTFSLPWKASRGLAHPAIALGPVAPGVLGAPTRASRSASWRFCCARVECSSPTAGAKVDRIQECSADWASFCKQGRCRRRHVGQPLWLHHCCRYHVTDMPHPLWHSAKRLDQDFTFNDDVRAAERSLVQHPQAALNNSRSVATGCVIHGKSTLAGCQELAVVC